MPSVETFARIDAVTLEDVTETAGRFVVTKKKGDSAAATATAATATTTSNSSGSNEGGDVGITRRERSGSKVALAALGKIDQLPDYEWVGALFTK